MRIDLPQSVYETAEQVPLGHRLGAWIAFALVLVCAWQLLGLPYALVKRYLPPADIPWFARGLRGVFIKPDNTWVIFRKGYADRMGKYEITAQGRLTRHEETGVFTEKDVSGVEQGGGKRMLSGNYVDVKTTPHSPYMIWRRELRELETKNDAGYPAAGGLLPSYTESADDVIARTEDHVTVATYGAIQLQLHPVLEGHHFFPVFDSWGYIDPHLWLTTDRGKFLHRVYVSDSVGEMDVHGELSVPVDLGVEVERECAVGHDPQNQRVFVLLASGNRFWFDPSTLEMVDQDTLPGVWAYEHASLGDPEPGYNFGKGLPLSRAGYERLMRLLMLVFLGCLLYLAIQWRQAWKYIADATTGVSNSSDRSPST